MLTPLYLTILIIIIGGAGLAWNRAHLLSALLCLELMLIALFSALAFWSASTANFLFASTVMPLLALSACETGAGLALLVSITRTHGSDLVRALNLLR
nr:NADH dehydrogenase subunit 4L [Yoda sp. d ASH-2021]